MPRLSALNRSLRSLRVRSRHLSLEGLEDRVVPTLDLSISPTAFLENQGAGAAQGTLTRSGDLSQPMMVTLRGNDNTEARVPSQVTIAAGQSQAFFNVDAVDDILVDGTRQVRIDAASGGAVPVSFLNSIGPTTFDIKDIAVHTDGKIIAVGGTTDFLVARFNSDGTPDLSFSFDGLSGADVGGSADVAEAVVVQPDGKIIVGGYGRMGSTSNPFGIALARFNVNGTLDTTFGGDGTVIMQPSPGFYNEIWDLALLPFGDIIAVGTVTYDTTGNDFGIFQFSPNGSLNRNFGSGAGFVSTDWNRASDRAYGVEVQPNGTIIVVGEESGGNSHLSRFAVARYLGNGQLDSSFNGDGNNDGKISTDFDVAGYYEAAQDVAIYPDGRIVAVGQVSFSSPGAVFYDTALIRFNPNGSLDTTFGNGGKVTTNFSAGTDRAMSAVVEPDGRLVVTGGTANDRGFVARYLMNGVTDARLTTVATGAVAAGQSVAFTPQGDIIVGGTRAASFGGGFLERFTGYTPFSDSVTVDVLDDESNQPPTANDDSYATDEDNPLTIATPGVLGNDSDPESSPLTAVKVSDPTNGTLTLNANGSFTYTPNLNFNGTDSFTYKANDGDSDSNIATATITVRSVNDAPVANSDVYATDEDTPLQIAAPGLLGNDSDVDSATLTAIKVSDPTNGSVTLNADGSFTYTPNLNFSGTDSFTYKANDGSADSNAATVILLVRPVNDAPIANNDAYAVDEDTPLQVAASGVLGNDSDVDSTTLTAILVRGPANGSVTLNADGSFTYTPNLNFNGTDSFTYKANDGSADSNIATVTITVRPVNDAPIANNDAYAVDEDTPLQVAASGVLGNDSDVDSTTLTAILVRGPANGSVTLNADGSFTYTPNRGFNGADSFTYRATDGSADSNVATVAITVRPVNGAPVANNDAYEVDEDTRLQIAAPGVLGNDTDGDSATLTAIKVSDPANGSVTLNADGSFTYTPNLNFNGTDRFTYKANDGSADSNVATVTITVRAVNDAPVANRDAYAVDEDTPLQIAAPGVLGNDTDGDSSTLTAIKVSDPTNGSVTLNVDGSFTYTPNLNFNGTDSFTYRANDGSLDSNVATVTITVRPVNDAPVANNDAYAGDEDTLLRIAAPGLLGNDSDLDNNSLTATKVSDPTNGSVTVNADGSFTYTPNLNFNGTDRFTYKANDGNADSNIATVTITVRPVNDAPIARNDVYSTDEDTPLSIPAPGVLGNDTDEENNPLSALIVQQASNGTVALAADGSFVYTPNANFSGTDSFTYRANDGSANSNVATVGITVRGVNDAPIAGNDSYRMTSGGTLRVNAPGVLSNDRDADGDVLSAVRVSNPANGTLTFNADGSFTYVPTTGFTGTDSFTYMANDGLVDSNVATVTLTVDPAVATEGKVSGTGRLDRGVRRFELNVDARLRNGALIYTGHLRFEDLARGIDLRSTAITYVRVEDDGFRGTVHGTATVNGRSGYTFIVDVEDNGEPGKDVDTFRIRIVGPNSFAYDSLVYALNGGIIEQGNIQVRRRV